jgi:CP family cyanate transporter-like MFS transporter
MPRLNPALLVVLGGVSAALHVGKLPTALPVLREAMGATLLEAGFLLSLVQLAGMSLGLAVGLAADGLGLKRTMVTGLLVLSLASLLGGWADGVGSLMLLRAFEGLGFLLASMPAPSLIRRLVEPGRMRSALGMWGAYMPFGTAVALLCGPFAIAQLTWQGWWRLLAVVSAIMASWLWRSLPPDPARVTQPRASAPQGWRRRLRETLLAPGPWLVALSFAMYSGQWLAVIGFLPSMYAQAGFDPGLAGLATAAAALVNMVGNIAAGRLLERGVPAQNLLYAGFAVMGLGALVAFAPSLTPAAAGTAPFLRYAAVVLFSMVGGLVPGTLFYLAVRLAPGEHAISTTVGWMQQWSAAGQFLGPPLVAFVATLAGGWGWSWVVTGACATVGLALAAATGVLLRRVPAARGRQP